MDDLSFYVPNVHFEQIPIKNLVSNQDYQRNLSQAHIERAAAHFDLYQINPVIFSLIICYFFLILSPIYTFVNAISETPIIL